MGLMTNSSILSASLFALTIILINCGRSDVWGENSNSDIIIIDPTPTEPAQPSIPGEESEKTIILPGENESEARSCELTKYSEHTDSEGNKHVSTHKMCFENDSHKWQTNCNGENCQKLKVFAHYMLPSDIGNDLTVQIEAFDNHNFSGAPISTVQINKFQATMGFRQETSLYLSPGSYYLRAFIRTDNAANIPYNFGDLELVAEKPLGVYGALSSPEAVLVEGNHAGEGVVHIFLDKFFKQPGSEPATNARFRIKFTTPDISTLIAERTLKIGLYRSNDLEEDAVYSFEMLSDLFLVQGRLGSAEYVSSSLAEGNYVLFAYLDNNGNGFFDEGELSALHEELGEAKFLVMQKDHTKLIELELKLKEAE